VIGTSVIIGVDVGGTFTDLFMLDPAFRTCKVPSHRGNEARGFLDALAAVGELGVATPGSIVHGTTVGTNTILERRGPRIGVITTRGFRDVLEMRRRDRRRTWGLWGDFVPIAERDMRLEVDERTLADGTVRRSVDRAEVRAAAGQLLKQGAESVAITFINTYANPENEQKALAQVRALWPNEYVSASHEVLAEIREFERFSTTALNAYLQPVVGSYLGKLEAALAGASAAGTLHIVQSNGGIMSTASARSLPVHTALSGPAAGVVAAAALATAAGHDNIITCDLGGTSFDVCVIAGGKAAIAAQTTVDFGLVIRTPMIEITTIGGGRRLARIRRSRRTAAGGPGKRGVAAGSRLLRARQYAPDAHGRAGRARPHQCTAPAWRGAQIARRRSRQTRD
jgi:N-methylhydantoinase A